MSFSRATLQEIVNRVDGDIKGALNLGNILRRSFLGALSRGISGVAHTLFGFIAFAILQMFPDTMIEFFLLRWGNLFGVVRTDATFAQLNVTFTGTTGGTVLVDTILQRDDGVLYKLNAEVIVPPAATAVGIVTAEEPEAIANFTTFPGALSLQSPIAGVETDVAVDSTNVEAEDQETIEAYRARVIQRMQQPPAGGNPQDYVSFVLAVPGITRAWVLPGNRGEGTVDTTGVEDGNAPASIIPSPAKVAEIQVAVDLKKPVTADHIAFAPIEFTMNPVIALKPNTTDVQNAVIAELNDMLLREAQVRGGFKEVGTTFDGVVPLSKINEAISLADGEEDHVLTSPTTDVQPSQGGLVTLGTPVFSTLP